MTTRAHEYLTAAWNALGGSAKMLDTVQFAGEVGLVSAYPVTDFAAATLAGAALEIVELAQCRGGPPWSRLTDRLHRSGLRFPSALSAGNCPHHGTRLLVIIRPRMDGSVCTPMRRITASLRNKYWVRIRTNPPWRARWRPGKRRSLNPRSCGPGAAPPKCSPSPNGPPTRRARRWPASH